jgi:hypothetical protein
MTMAVEGTEERGRLTEWADIHKFVFAGNATFTLVGKTARYTFKMRMKDSINQPGAVVYFVSLLNGPDNENNYEYIGMLTDKDRQTIRTSRATRVAKEAGSFKAISWFLARMAQGGEPSNTLEFWHEGRCCRCGRKLTVPSSVASGIGPECAGRMEGF